MKYLVVIHMYINM